MSKLFAIGSQDKWDLLSPAEQAFYEDHYETLTLFASAKYGEVDTDSGDYIVTWLGSNLVDTISSQIYIDTDLGSNEIVFDGENKFSLEDNLAGNYLFRVFSNTRWKNIYFKRLVDKGTTSQSIIKMDAGSYTIENIVFDGNGRKGTFVIYESSGVYVNSVFMGTGYTGLYGPCSEGNDYTDSETTLFVNCVLHSNHRDLKNIAALTTATLRNVYAESFDATYTDGGGNVSGDSSAPEVANRNISLSSAFVDLVNLIPTVLLNIGVDPTLPEASYSSNGIERVAPYYVGANRPIPSFGIESRRFSRNNNLMFKNGIFK